MTTIRSLIAGAVLAATAFATLPANATDYGWSYGQKKHYKGYVSYHDYNEYCFWKRVKVWDAYYGRYIWKRVKFCK
jgi:hypothetical protein